MAIDPCLDGCTNHNIGSNTVPVAGDDPCNSAGNGIYCQGSYWSYDPTAAGADPDTDGDCPRLFLRTGSDCNVDQWLEISVASIITETRDPVDGDDCCPPGTLWHRTDLVNDVYWISTNDGGCTWCQICIPHNLTAAAPPTAGDCVTGGYATGSIWKIPAGTLAGQLVDMSWHLIDDVNCTWCRMCGGTGIAASNRLVQQNIPDATTVIANLVGPEDFDVLGEFDVNTNTTTLRASGRYQYHIEAQLIVQTATPRIVVRFGHDINGGGVAFWPNTQSFLNVPAGQTINFTGASQAMYLGAGDTIEIAVSHFGSGGNVILDSYVLNIYDLAHSNS